MRKVGRAAIGCCCLVLTACAAFSSTPPDDGEVHVAAAFYPLAFVAERVAGTDATVVNLTSPGTEPHDLELTVQETAQIARADLVMHLDGFQPALDDAIGQNATGVVVDAAEYQAWEDDPHLWLDLALMAQLTDEVAAELSVIDPAHAEGYGTRAEQLTAELFQLADDYKAGLASCDRHLVVVSHDAFRYLGYNLEFEAIAGLSPGAEPTPADLARLHELVKNGGITTVFSERLVGEELAQTLAEDLGVKTAVLDPIEGLTDETEDEDYLSLMRQNLDALREANRCR